MSPWASAFLIALGMTVLAIPLLRRLALATDFVDRPAARKSHHRPVPYLGGVALITSVLVAILAERRLQPRIAGLVLGAAVIGTIGLLDDDRTLPPALRFGAEAGAAAMAVALGLRIHATGIVGIDVLLTVVWIVGITNAMNLLDNMDGLAAGITAVASAALFWLAFARGQQVTATVAAALVGACLGFLVYNRRPARVFMGDTGSLFLGFVLAVVTVDVDPALMPPASFAIPLILLALPVLDTTTVTLARLRRGKSVSEGGKDHLSHRLVALGHSPGRAVLILIGVEAFAGVMAVLAGRRVLPLGWAVAAVAASLLALSVYTSRPQVYVEPVVGLPRRLLTMLFGGAATVVLLAGAAVLALQAAADPATEASNMARAALSSLRQGDSQEAIAQLQASETMFERARERVHSPLASAGLVVPGLSSNVRAARVLVETGADLTGLTAYALALADGRQAHANLAAPALTEATRLAPVLDEGAQVLRKARQDLLTAESYPYLLPPFREGIERLATALDASQAQAERASLVSTLLPVLGGQFGERRYLLAFQGGGGAVEAWSELVMTGTEARLNHLAPPAVSVSPDFPTTARELRDAHERTAGVRADGVIAMDALGLAKVGRLAGGSPDGATPSVETVRRVWDTAVSTDLGTMVGLARVLGEGVDGGNIMAFLVRPEEQRLVSELGADGAVPNGNPDLLMVANRDGTAPAAGSLRQRVRYNVHVHPGEDGATLSGELEVTLENPGSAERSAPPTTADLTVFSALVPRSASVDGSATAVDSGPKLGRQVASVSVTVPPGEVRTLRMQLEGTVELRPGGWYGLSFLRQPTVGWDQAQVTVAAPEGWRVAETLGLEQEESGSAQVRLNGERRHTLWVRLERSGWARIWHRLFNPD